MKKKILFTAYNLDIGGIESALINMLKVFDYDKYDVTLLLEKYEGIFIDSIPKDVHVEVYKIYDDSNVILRKVKNRIKLCKWIIKNYHKYDFAGCFATYSIPGSILVRYASLNNALWVHSNYYYVYHENVKLVEQFFSQRSVDKFKKIVFVSNEARDSFNLIFPKLKSKTLVLNNILDYREIIKKSKEKVLEKKPAGKLFLFVGRLDEESKRLSRLFESFSKINDKNTFLWIVGDGPSKDEYLSLVKDLKIDQRIKFLGKKSNPYPYILMCDIVVLTSDYEGFPVICMESIILNKPFLSTVSISDKYINLSDYGFIVDKDPEKIYDIMNKFMNGELSIKNKFIYSQYQKKLENDLFSLIEEESI